MTMLICALAMLGSATAAVEQAPAPVVSTIRFDGAEYFREETLLKMLGTRVGEGVDADQVLRDERAIGLAYRERGFVRATVRSELVASAGQAVVVFHVQPGARAPVRRVLVEGNRNLTDAEASAGLFTKPEELLGALKQAGVFHARRLDADLQQVARNYYRRGYLEVQVVRWRAMATPDGEAIDVAIDVVEGPLYRLGELHVVGDLPAPETDLVRDLKLKPGDVADIVALGDNLDRMLDRWRDIGHPFPAASQAARLDPLRHELLITFDVQRGPAARVGEIRVTGEPWTARRVIDRELTLRPGQSYSLAALRRSRERLMASGLFMEAKLTPVRALQPDLVDVEIELTERPGMIKDCILSIAPAYFQSEGLIGIGLLMCPNLLGQSQQLSAIVQLSALRQLFDVAFVEPRLFDSHLSLNLGVHRRQLVYPLFSSNSTGAGAGLVAPLGVGLRGSLEYRFDLVDVAPGDRLAAFADSARFPQGALRSAVELRLSHDTRSGSNPSALGAYHSVSVASGGWWTLGEVSFVELRGTARYYLPLVFGALLKLNLSAANVADPTGKPVVVSERYFAGGFGSVRGYWPRSLGPRQTLGDPTDPAAPAKRYELGGVREVTGNAEVEIPIVKEWDLKGFVFVDAGNTYDERETWFLIGHWQDGREVPLPLGLYSSLGVGALIPTGTLPIRLEWSVPLTRRPGDRDVDFFFGVGGFF